MSDLIRKTSIDGAIPPSNWCSRSYINANEAFEGLYYGLNKDGDESSPRGLKIRETLGCDITILNPKDNIVFNSQRLTSPYYLAQEYFWYLSGDHNVDSISKYAGFWKRIADENGILNSNYGAYIFDKDYMPINSMSQYDYLIYTLRKDPDSRQAILQIPITQTKGSKDVCCTSSLQFFIRNDRLNMTTYMRSNDIVKGFCNDITFFCTLQMMIAVELGIEVGWYRHCVGSLHVYESDFIENVDRKFYVEMSNHDMRDSTINCYNNLMHDFYILRDRKKENLFNPVLKYMADNFDNKKK